MNIAEPFIRRPIATILLALAVLLSGMWAYTLLPISPLPRVDFPTIQVSASLPGASPETMASSVATPLERRFGRIAGVSEITSSSTLGSTSITLQFDLDRDIDAAARDVQAAISAAAGELPPNMPSRPNFRKVNPADAPSMILSLTSDTVSLTAIYDVANTVLAQKVAQVEGVGQVTVIGGQNPAVRLQVDPVALAGAGLSLEDVRNAIAGTTLDSPKGALVGNDIQRTIAANDQLFGAKSYEHLIVGNSNGVPVKFSDIGTAIDSVENVRSAAWVDGKRAIALMVRRQPGANIIETNERVKRLLPAMQKAMSPGIKMSVAIDRTQTIRASVADVERTLILSVLLVVGVVFLFLRNWRATFVPSIAVPLSLIGTFGAMFMLSYSLDNLSLMALTISTGFVVDDAIVMVENISRHIDMGKTPFQAALDGSREVGFTIVSITISLIAVFIPILLMGGIVGRLFREFAVTLTIAVAFSALVSLTVTPSISARLLRSHNPKEGVIGRTLERMFDGLTAAYGWALDQCLRHRKTVGASLIVTIGITGALYYYAPKGLFPQQDTGSLQGSSDAPQDVSFPYMYDHALAANRILMDDPDVAHVVSFIGNGTVNTGNAFMELKPMPPRKASADAIVARLRGKLSKLTGIQMYLQSVQDLRMGGRASRTQYQYTLQDASVSELQSWAERMTTTLAKMPELRDVATDQQAAGLELELGIDRDTASRLGITPTAIDNILYDAYGQRQIATNFAASNQYRVVLEVKPAFQIGPTNLGSLYVPSPGGLVPLSQITHQNLATTWLSINHQGQFPATTISFNLAPNGALGPAVDAIHKVETKVGLPPAIKAAFAGTAQAFESSLSSEGLLILFALVVVYIVLGVLYESWLHPLTIISTLPSAGLGALLALRIANIELSVIAIVGLLLLIGIVKKNAILMIDFALETERAEGLPPLEAVRKACLLRFRPILMTTFAALLGALPLIFGTAVGSELRRPLGIAIVGGLLLSQILTLFTTPITYLALESLAGKRKSHEEDLELANS